MKKNYSAKKRPTPTLKKGVKSIFLLFLLLVLDVAHTYAQDVTIPDTNFKNALLSNTAINTNNDTEISYNEAAAFTGRMSVSSKDIADLTGIEAFVNITELNCNFNSLTSLDISANTALTELWCRNNALTSLDVSANTALTFLFCNDTALTSLDVSANTALTELYCYNNALTSLDVSANTALTTLYCFNTALTSLDVSANTALTKLWCDYNNALTSLNVANGNNTSLITFVAENNPNLSCIQVDDVTYSNSNWANDIDATARFSTDCSIVYIPDTNFKNALLSNTAINTNNDTEISYNEAAAFTGTISVPYREIADLTGIEAFVNITELYCWENALTSLDVSANTALTELWCSSNDLTSLDVSANTALTNLRCYDNAFLTSLDVSANTALTVLWCSESALTSLDVSANTALTVLSCFNTALTSLDVSANTALTGLYCYNNDITSLDVSANTALTVLYCYNNDITSLDVSANTALTGLWCSESALTSLDVSANTALTVLSCYNNDITSLDVSANTALTELWCYRNALTSLDVSANTALTGLRCENNALTSLDVSANIALSYLYCWENALTSLDVSANTALAYLDCHDNDITSLNVANGNNTSLITFVAENNPNLSCIQVDDVTYSNSNWANDIDATASFSTDCRIVYIPDTNFKNALLSNTAINTDNDTEISYNEAAAFTGTMDVSSNYITELTGIEAFVNITKLECQNNDITSLDVSANTALTELWCWENALTSIDVSANTALTELRCFNTALTSLDVSANTALTELYCWENALTSLDVSANTALTQLMCWDNALTSLEVSANTALTYLWCYGNALTSLDVSANTALSYLYCYNNALTSLDVSANTALAYLDCHDNDITSLNVANGNNTSLITFVAENNPNLSCIQVDDVTYSNSNWANDIDATARFSTDCSIVYIPDANFKNALLSNTAINTTNDSEISYNEAAAFTGTMDVSFNNIADLTGIEAFVNITRLYCNYNNLTSLEVANNLTLEELRCYSNNLTSLDVSANTALTRLICYDNALTSLDISANTTLTSLYCNNNALTSLNVANGNNTSLITFVAENNPNLSCIQVDDVTYSNSNWTDNIDATASFSTDCRIVYIPDANFKNALLSNTAINTNNDMEISYNEAANVTEISVLYRGIADLTGIEAFVNITELNCSSNSLTSLDISANTALTRLYCANTALTSIDVSANTALTDLWCYGNALTSLDVSANTALTWLDCSNTALTSLNIANGNNTNVYQFDARNNPNLSCIQVDDVTYSNTNWANDIDGTASFSTNCGTGKATKTKTTTNVNVATVIDSSLDNELLFNDTIRVSPNPVINTFSITGSASFKLKQVKMYNVLNEVVLSSTNNQVDASSLPTGMYILKIESTDGEIQTKKIIKK